MEVSVFYPIESSKRSRVGGSSSHSTTLSKSEIEEKIQILRRKLTAMQNWDVAKPIDTKSLGYLDLCPEDLAEIARATEDLITYKDAQEKFLSASIRYYSEINPTDNPTIQDTLSKLAENCEKLATIYSKLINTLRNLLFEDANKILDLIRLYDKLISEQIAYLGMCKNQTEIDLDLKLSIDSLNSSIREKCREIKLDLISEYKEFTPIEKPITPPLTPSLVKLCEAFNASDIREINFSKNIHEFKELIDKMIKDFMLDPNQLITFIEQGTALFSTDIRFGHHWITIDDVYHELTALTKPIIAKTTKHVFESNIEGISLPDQKTAYIFPDHDNTETILVGDLHGDSYSLLAFLDRENILERLKTEDIRIVFLGDYIDRGFQPLEVLLMIMYLKINYPDKIFISKGNHETSHMVDRGTFKIDISEKLKGVYPEKILEIIAAFKSFFSLLPYMSIYGDVLLAHGGIPVYKPSDESDHRFFTTVPCSLHGFLASANEHCSLLWGDPKSDITHQAFTENMERGGGVYCFNPDVVMPEISSKLGINKDMRGHTAVVGPGDPKANVVTIHSTGGGSVTSGLGYRSDCPIPFYGVIKGGNAELPVSKRPFELRRIYD